MKKLIILLILLFAVSSYSATLLQMQESIVTKKKKGSAVCAEFYDPGVTADTDRPFGDNAASVDYYGMRYDPQSNQCICKVTVNISRVDGTPGARNYHMTIFQLDGADAASRSGTSAAVNLVAAGDYDFVFSPCVAVTTDYNYGLGLFVDTDADLTDDPGTEGDASNHGYFGDDNGGAPGGAHLGRWYGSWDAAIPYTGNISNDDDGVDFIIWTE